MKHKELRTMGEWWDLHPKLRLIMCDADHFLHKRGTELIITSAIRSDLEQWALFKQGKSAYESSVHQYGRGIDARVLTPEHLNEDLLSYINTKYPYSHKRPNLKTVILHGGTAPHLHFQCAAS